MKLTHIKRYISSVFLLIPHINSLADNTVTDAYALPKDKSAEEVCLKTALKAHPGQVFSFKLYNEKPNFHYQYEINDKEKNWLVVCDGATKRIIKDESEDSPTK